VLCTAGYSGLGVTWHWGLSGSATLLSATPKHAFESLIGVVPTSVTIFSGYALIMTVLALIYVPIILYLIAPKSADRCRGISHWDREAMARSDAKSEAARGDGSIAEAINNSRIIGGLIAIIGLAVRAHAPVARLESPQKPEFAEHQRPRAQQMMRFLDGELASRRFIASDDFTIADITAIVAMDLTKAARVEIPQDLPNLSRWRADVSARPSVVP